LKGSLAVADPWLNFGGSMEGAKVQRVHTSATKLAKHSVKQRETKAIGGGENSSWIHHCSLTQCKNQTVYFTNHSGEAKQISLSHLPR